MTKEPNKKTPHVPGKGSTVQIQINLEDLCKKAATKGALVVLGETVLNLCLLANDQISLARGGKLRGSTLTDTKT